MARKDITINKTQQDALHKPVEKTIITYDSLRAVAKETKDWTTQLAINKIADDLKKYTDEFFQSWNELFLPKK